MSEKEIKWTDRWILCWTCEATGIKDGAVCPDCEGKKAHTEAEYSAKCREIKLRTENLP